jgi:5-methylcytosine-specific restriction endonuclease McrBC regulatory subunit McrC
LNFGITQTDFYQVFSYAKIYEKNHNNGYKNKVILLYPKNETDEKLSFNFNDSINLDDKTKLQIQFIDLSLLINSPILNINIK